MANIKIYKFPQTVVVTMTSSNMTNINLPLTDTDFKVYHGVDNPVDFIVKDINSRPIDLTNTTVSIIVSNFNDNTHLLTKDAEIVDALCGKFKIIFLSSDIADWPLGFQRYSLISEGIDGTIQPLFLDQDHNASGFFELLGGVIPAPKDSVVVLGEEFTPVSITPGITKFLSCAFPGDAFFCNNDGLHTVAISADNYTGKFFVQASLEESTTQSENEWFDIFLNQLNPELKLTEFTGIEPFNFTGSVRWVRFVHIPDPTNEGTIIKVAYRN